MMASSSSAAVADGAGGGGEATGPEVVNKKEVIGGGKIDPITALQDGIDGLSLAMFEALRGLRDAVAPESGNLGGGNNNNPNAAAGAAPGGANNNNNANTSGEPDMEELWTSYRSGDKDVVAMIHSKVGQTGGVVPQKREDFIRLCAKMEMEKDTELVMKLASTVLEKSAQINEQVDTTIPGMDRNKQQQMKRIEELIILNQSASKNVEESYRIAKQRRNSCRTFIMNKTCQALGIEEEGGEH